MIFGTKIIRPTTAAAIAHTNTAPAATSFTNRMLSLRSALTASANFSMAVFSISAPNTMPMHSAQAIYSPTEIRNPMPAAITHAVTNK